MNHNSNLWKIINLFWIIIVFVPYFNGLGFIYAGWRVNETKWIDEGIIYMIPFLFLTFTIFNIYIVYLTLIFLLIGIIRAFMIIKPFLIKLEEKDSAEKSIQYTNDVNTVEDNKNIIDSIDINNVSIEDLRKSGLFDNYKIDQIIKLRKEGYVFKSIDDLSQKLHLTKSEIDELRRYVKINQRISNSRKLDI